MSPSPLATRLHMPAWWVRARDEAGRGEVEGALGQAARAGVAPAMSPLELNALAMIIARFQERLLTSPLTGQAPNEDPTWSLALVPDEHLKDSGTAARSRRFAFEKVLQLAAGLRVLVRDPKGGFRAVSVFGEDRWEVDPKTGQGALVLSPTGLGRDLLLGYAHPYKDLARAASGKPQASLALGGTAPLSLWRSVWLELGEMEQHLFLRMEQGMQWEFRWLQLEGIFGLPVEKIFDGVRLPDPGGQKAASLAQRLKILARLGRRLTAHGLIVPAAADQYLALGTGDGESDELALNLVWQVSRERLFEEEAIHYRQAVCRAFAQDGDERFVQRILPLVIGRSPSAGEGRKALALWNALRDATEEMGDAHGLDTLKLDDATPLPLPWLLWEWQTRRGADGGYPWPDTLASAELAHILDDSEPLPLRVKALGEWLASREDMIQALGEIPYVTVVSSSTRNADGFASRLAGLAGLVEGGESARTSFSPRLVDSGISESRAERQETEKSEETSPRKAALSGALASRMRRVATEELAKMRRADPEGYRELKKSYMDSLDEEGRRLILDVGRRMQAKVFEEHLRSRLIRFMVENPGSWRSADCGGASQVTRRDSP